MKVPAFTWIAWIAIIGSIIALMFLRQHIATQPGMTLSQAEFLAKFKAGEITHCVVSYNPQSFPLTEISGKYLTEDAAASATNKTIAYVKARSSKSVPESAPLSTLLTFQIF